MSSHRTSHSITITIPELERINISIFILQKSYQLEPKRRSNFYEYRVNFLEAKSKSKLPLDVNKILILWYSIISETGNPFKWFIVNFYQKLDNMNTPFCATVSKKVCTWHPNARTPISRKGNTHETKSRAAENFKLQKKIFLIESW